MTYAKIASRMLAGTAALAMLAGCGGDAEEEAETADPSAVMLPGEYRLTSQITEVASADGSTPATALQEGQAVEASVCIGDDGLIPPAALGEEGDSCEYESPYYRRGRFDARLNCNRDRGRIDAQIKATYTDESIEGSVRGASSFAGDGDFTYTRDIKGERTGDCTPGEADEQLDDVDVEGA